MKEFISTFITGFENIVVRELQRNLREIRIIRVYSGLIHYGYNGDIQNINRLFFLNNTFALVKAFTGSNLTFELMVNKVSKTNFESIVPNSTFRVRFSRENQFSKVSKKTCGIAEQTILHSSKLRLDRLNPNTEFWYIIRSEGIGFFGQLLSKRRTTEKLLQKGELRPEFAYLLCGCCDINPHSIVCDPFAGYGAIPLQIVKHFKFKKLYVNDNGKGCFNYLSTLPLAKNRKVILSFRDALHLDHIPDASVDTIITDPPWGMYNHIGDVSDFYCEMLIELMRILTHDGTLVVLTGKVEELRDSARKANIRISSDFSTLVNGKKASVFILDKHESI